MRFFYAFIYFLRTPARLLSLLSASAVVFALLSLVQYKSANSNGSATFGGEVAQQLSAVLVVDERPTITGYERDRFGGWADSDSCNTREKVLVEWFGGFSCHVHLDSTVSDPYTGKSMTSTDVDIDHIFPLAAAWDLGASRWDPQKRKQFANDIEHNLMPTKSMVNREKSDKTPAEWLPATELACAYANRYLTVAIKWELAITVDDWKALAASCDINVK